MIRILVAKILSLLLTAWTIVIPLAVVAFLLGPLLRRSPELWIIALAIFGMLHAILEGLRERLEQR